uniref:SSD domain-containing protein n=1 Tax=Plectus sambesii TaxID=2011161 RepID=A0A914URL5_9BILA
MVMIALSLVGLINFEQINNTRTEFTPINAPSREEYAIVENFLQQNGSLFFIHLLIQAKDGGSLLRSAERHELRKIAHELQYDLKVTKNGREYGFTDMCEPYCGKNEAFTTFLKIYDSELRKPTYPVMDNFGMRTFIGNNIFSVKVNNRTDEVEDFKAAVLNFFIVVKKTDEDLMKMWEKAALKVVASGKYKHLDAGLLSDNLSAEEVQRMGSETAPLLAGSIVFMILFVMLTSFRYERRRSKPWEALVGAIIPVFANISAIGLMSACGLKFQSIVVCTLFLVLAVGCDSVFVMLRAWDVSKCHKDVVTRMAVTMKDAGPSITITSLTNALAFAVDI